MLGRLSRHFQRGCRDIRCVRNYYVKPKDKKKHSGQAYALLGGVATSIICGSVFVLGRPEEVIAGLETEPDPYANTPVVKAYLLRAKDSIMSYRKTFTEPSNQTLLPDHLPQYQPPYTLLIELRDILLHYEYDNEIGWKFQKRPGLDYFLEQIAPYYEVVLFTAESGLSINEIVDQMDPKHIIMYRLYRDATKYEGGHHIKDLTHLNRSLNRVIMLDTDQKSVQFQPENSIILEKWTGDIYDQSLIDLASFLITISVSGTSDVRPTLDYYKSQENLTILEAFRANQARLREIEEKRQAVTSRSTSGIKKQNAHSGSIDVFSLGSIAKQYTQTPPTESCDPVPPPQTTPTSQDSSSQSWSQWAGSWVGLK